MPVCTLSHVQLLATPWTVAHQAPLSMGFCRQEYWSGLPFPSPGDLSDPGIELVSFVSPVLAGRFFTSRAIGGSNVKIPVMSDFLQPHGLYSLWNSQDQNTGVGSLSFLQGIFPNSGIKPRSPTLLVNSLPAELPGKPLL